jgi:hypothetical protein
MSVVSRVMACAVACCIATTAIAQEPERIADPWATLPVGSDVENYLRYLQTLGAVSPNQWSIRGFSPSELRLLVPPSPRHPWSARLNSGAARNIGSARVELAPSRVGVWYNSAFPYGTNDGPVWKGRGFTIVAEGGFTWRGGPVSLTLAPSAFYAENRPFELMPTGHDGRLAYADPARPLRVDRPQRFGDAAYARIDPGESTLQVSVVGMRLGISSASMWWGPMTEYPYVLGNNAGGFAHFFIGSGRGWDVGIGRAHGKLIYGRLEQSSFADSTVGPGRFASGLIGVFTPRGAPGLEIGFARFYHTPARAGGPTARDFLKPFDALLKNKVRSGGGVIPGDPTTDEDNQLGSVFFRWVLPRSGFEAYGEYGREDHSGNTRDLLTEPDHSASYGLGFRRAWRTPTSIAAIRGELMSMDPSTLNVHRAHGWTYTHTVMRQGHTHRGQLLGAGFGTAHGGAATVTAERFDNGGGMTALSISRSVQRQRLTVSGRPDSTLADQEVQHAVTLRRSLRQRHIDLGWELNAIHQMNRNLRSDSFGASAAFTIGRW